MIAVESGRDNRITTSKPDIRSDSRVDERSYKYFTHIKTISQKSVNFKLRYDSKSKNINAALTVANRTLIAPIG